MRVAAAARAAAADPRILGERITEVLIEEALAGDEEILARRRVLARRDPIACLLQLQRLNRKLLAETERRLRDHAMLCAVLRIQTAFRGKTASSAIRCAQTIGRDRIRVRDAMKWLKQQRMLLRNEARTLVKEAEPRLARKVLDLRRRLVSSEYRSRKDEYAGGGLPADLSDPVYATVREAQRELLNVEAAIRRLNQVMTDDFDRIINSSTNEGLGGVSLAGTPGMQARAPSLLSAASASALSTHRLFRWLPHPRRPRRLPRPCPPAPPPIQPLALASATPALASLPDQQDDAAAARQDAQAPAGGGRGGSAGQCAPQEPAECLGGGGAAARRRGEGRRLAAAADQLRGGRGAGGGGARGGGGGQGACRSGALHARSPGEALPEAA